jgi:hypothetical protein
MPVIVVGGQTKNVGKTTLICNIVEAFSTIKWTAVKISNHLHSPELCKAVRKGAGWTIWQQSDTTDQSDTARFLRSGAYRALFLQAERNSLQQACIFLEQELQSAGAAIVESASGVSFLRHDVFLMLLDPAKSDFKEAARQQIDRVAAFVTRGTELEVGRNIDSADIKPRPAFRLFPTCLDPELASMLAAKFGTSV